MLERRVRPVLRRAMGAVIEITPWFTHTKHNSNRFTRRIAGDADRLLAVFAVRQSLPQFLGQERHEWRYETQRRIDNIIQYLTTARRFV